MFFYDTNALLFLQEKILKEEFYISSTSLTELENIKISKNKDEDTKFRARKILHILDENEEFYKLIITDETILSMLNSIGMEDTPDNRICACATVAVIRENGKNDIIFCTNDLACKMIAKNIFKLNVCGVENDAIYKGYISVTLSDEQLAVLYENLNVNQFHMLINQYLLVKDMTGKIVDVLKWTEIGFQTVRQKPIKSNMFGTLKPLDEIQRCAIDSMMANDVTVMYGRSGSGKTTLPLNYIMQGIEKGTFKKCYVIFSYEPLKGARTLGYEKGDHVTKLLYSASIGNILASKFGDIQQVERMIDLGQLEIIPTANIRGLQCESDSVVYVTEGQNLNVYTLKTIIQRCKDGCKQIYEGDIIEQKDANISELGMKRLIEVFKGHPKFGCLKLKNNYRGELVELADEM